MITHSPERCRCTGIGTCNHYALCAVCKAAYAARGGTIAAYIEYEKACGAPRLTLPDGSMPTMKATSG